MPLRRTHQREHGYGIDKGTPLAGLAGGTTTEDRKNKHDNHPTVTAYGAYWKRWSKQRTWTSKKVASRPSVITRETTLHRARGESYWIIQLYESHGAIMDLTRGFNNTTI